MLKKKKKKERKRERKKERKQSASGSLTLGISEEYTAEILPQGWQNKPEYRCASKKTLQHKLFSSL